MILKNLSAMWEAFAPALGNHLWQSTLLVIAAGLLALLLRKNQARARYWLWLAASLKFLVPFSLLAGLGSYLSWSRGPAGANAGLYVVMEEISQPFVQAPAAVIVQATSRTVFQGLVDLLPSLLAAAWFFGFAAVLLVWRLRWRRISAALLEAVPLREGREAEALRRLEGRGWIRRPIEMRLSQASLEPGIFGIVHPVLVWPKGISERLDDAHVEAILAHEVWHVRRRDNLAAVAHMVVEAIFWFHPLVWWLGARLVEERERACDEEVLELGGDRQVYAESILKVCEFCVGSPLACVAGVTGADLKKRIVNIMTERTARKLNFGRKMLLGAVAALAVAGPIVYGLIKPSQSRAESQQSTAGAAPAVEIAFSQPDKSGIYRARMKNSLDGFTATGITPRELIQLAYGVDDRQIAGAPDWLGSVRFDINAKVSGAAAGETGKPGGDQRDPENRRRLQVFLADHFKLALHRETRDFPVYALAVAPNGPRLHEARPGDTYPDGEEMYGRKGAGLIHLEPDQITGQGVPLSSLTEVLSRRLGRTVVDRTGLKGNYDFKLHWAATADTPPTPESSAPAILAAVQDQMGLKLEAETIPLETLVIDHVEQPSLPQARNASVAAGFEVASIKENTTGEPMPPFHIVGKPFVAYMFKSDRFMATNATLFQLLQRAYSIESDQVAGGPDWIKSVPYDVDVKPDKSSLDAMRKLGGEEEQLSGWRRVLQTLFAERFKLTLHRETRELPVYALVIAPKGPKLKEAKPGDTYPDGVKRNDGSPQGHGLWVPGPGHLTGQGVSLGMLKGALSSRLGGRVVLDKTGLTGNYDFTLHWTPAEGGADSSAAILAAIQELGLKLEPQKAPMEVLVIDHAEKPVEK